MLTQHACVALQENIPVNASMAFQEMGRNVMKWTIVRRRSAKIQMLAVKDTQEVEPAFATQDMQEMERLALRSTLVHPMRMTVNRMPFAHTQVQGHIHAIASKVMSSIMDLHVLQSTCAQRRMEIAP
jgi:hypothetical protein